MIALYMYIEKEGRYSSLRYGRNGNILKDFQGITTALNRTPFSFRGDHGNLVQRLSSWAGWSGCHCGFN